MPAKQKVVTLGPRRPVHILTPAFPVTVQGKVLSMRLGSNETVFVLGTAR